MRRKKVILTSLTDMNFQKEVLENPEPVLVLFGAQWCGSCNLMIPILESLAEDFIGQIKFGKIDIDRQKKTAKQYGIRNLPTIVLFVEGRVADCFIGVKSRKVLAARLKAILKKE